MNFTTAKNAIGDFIEEILPSHTVIDHDQPRTGDSTGTPSPEAPWCSVRVTPVRRVGDQDAKVMDDEEYVHKGERIATVTLSLYGETSDEDVDAIRNSLQEYHKPTLFNAGVSYQRELGSIDSTTFLTTRNEKRATLTLQFSYSVEYRTSPGVIEHVTFEGDVVSDDLNRSSVSLDIDLT